MICAYGCKNALWQNQTMLCGYFDTTRKRNQSSCWTPTVVGGRRCFRLKFALKVTHPLRKIPTSTDFRLWRLNRNSLFTPSTPTKQNCLVLFCPCRRCEQIGDKTRQFCLCNLGLLWPWPLTFWPQNLISTSTNPNTSVAKIGWKSLY